MLGSIKTKGFVCAATMCTATLAAPAAAQDLRVLPRGEMEVHFRGPCTVYYDNRGRFTHQDSSCSYSQRRDADQMVSDRRVRGTNRYWNSRYRDAIVIVNPNGIGTVNLRNGCVVSYNRNGARSAASRPCNREMRNEADRLYRERRYGSSGRWEGGYRPPEVVEVGRTLHVRMTGRNCTYTYTRQGNHISTLGNQCNSSLRRQANEAVTRYRREQGM